MFDCYWRHSALILIFIHAIACTGIPNTEVLYDHECTRDVLLSCQLYADLKYFVLLLFIIVAD